MKIDVSELLQKILPKCKSDTELEHWLLQECRDRFGAEHAAAYKAISDHLDRPGFIGSIGKITAVARGWARRSQWRIHRRGFSSAQP